MSEPGALSAYLTEHMAGAVSVSDLARRGAKTNDGPLGTFYADLAREIDLDRRTLGSIAARVGIHDDGSSAAAQAEAVSLLLELELLYLGLQGKQVLWRTLQIIAGNDQRLADFDFGTLGARARDQLDAVEEQRLKLAATALRS